MKPLIIEYLETAGNRKETVKEDLVLAKEHMHKLRREKRSKGI